jgi:hypothetical protein
LPASAGTPPRGLTCGNVVSGGRVIHRAGCGSARLRSGLLSGHCCLGAVRGHIPRGSHQDLWIVVKVPDAHIALVAEQAADHARRWIVVYVPAFTATARRGSFADGAPVALDRYEVVPLLL